MSKDKGEDHKDAYIEEFDPEVLERLPFWVKEVLLMLKKKY